MCVGGGSYGRGEASRERSTTRWLVSSSSPLAAHAVRHLAISLLAYSRRRFTELAHLALISHGPVPSRFESFWRGSWRESLHCWVAVSV